MRSRSHTAAESRARERPAPRRLGNQWEPPLASAHAGAPRCARMAFQRQRTQLGASVAVKRLVDVKADGSSQ
jgi:hypothetical protein